MNIIRQISIIALLVVSVLLLSASRVYGYEPVQASVSSAQLKSAQPVQSDDIRVEKLRAYLTELNSPLVDNAEDFVAYADAYNMGENWSLVAAIAGVESTFGKHTPKNSYNAWGWGIPTGAQSGIGFESWEDGIETVTKGLKENYIDRGATTVPSMGRIYAPPSTTWARNVAFFMNRIETTSVQPELTL